MRLKEVRVEEERIVTNPNNQYDNVKIRIGLVGQMDEGDLLIQQITYLKGAVDKLLDQACLEKLNDYRNMIANAASAVATSFSAYPPSVSVEPPPIPSDLPPFPL